MMSIAALEASLNPAPMSEAQKKIMPSLMSYEVTLKDGNGNWLMGTVVTYCSLETWAGMRGYEIIEIGNVRRAEGSERTDLK